MKIAENLSGSMQKGPGSPKNAPTNWKFNIKHKKETTTSEKSENLFSLYIQTPDQLHQRPIYVCTSKQEWRKQQTTFVYLLQKHVLGPSPLRPVNIFCLETFENKRIGFMTRLGGAHIFTFAASSPKPGKTMPQGPPKPPKIDPKGTSPEYF